MKKLILILLLIPSLCMAAEPIDFSKSYARGMMMVGQKTPAAATGDSCTSGLLFSWHGENATVTTGTPAGCSAGDTTGTASSLAAISSTQYQDGSNAISIPSSEDYYSFDWSSSDILDPLAGKADFWFYSPTTVTGSTLMLMIVDASNRVQISLDAAGYIVINHYVGGVNTNARTNAGLFSANTWYHVICQWDKATAHSTLYLKCAADATTGTANSYDNGTTQNSGTWAGTSGSLHIGDYLADGGNVYIDNIKIYNAW